jgi:hypothetical protein
MVLYVLGAAAPFYFSKCGISRSTDLITWQQVPSPSLPHTHILSAARSASGIMIMSTNSGGMITTSDFQSYVTYDVDGKQSQFQKVIWNQGFVSVGFKRNNLLQEQAHVWRSSNAFDQYSWPASHIVQDDYSAFTDITTTAGTNLITVGHGASLSRSLLATGSYAGAWNLINLPSHVQGGLWSVASDGVSMWVGGRGWVASALLTNLQSWTRTNLALPHTVTSLLHHAGITYAAAGDTAYVSENGFDYVGHKLPGRTLTTLHVHDDQVLVGSHSLLTQHDLFVWDPITKVWQPRKSHVHGYAFVSI